MTELSFLLELLLNHKLPKVTRDAIATRIKDVESSYAVRSPSPALARSLVPPEIQGQAPSTVAAMMRHGKTGFERDAEETIAAAKEMSEPRTVEIIAHTPAAVAAMNSRAQAINESLSGKIDKRAGHPRKF